jgi:hypothetical protein
VIVACREAGPVELGAQRGELAARERARVLAVLPAAPVLDGHGAVAVDAQRDLARAPVLGAGTHDDGDRRVGAEPGERLIRHRPILPERRERDNRATIPRCREP